MNIHSYFYCPLVRLQDGLTISTLWNIDGNISEIPALVQDVRHVCHVSSRMKKKTDSDIVMEGGIGRDNLINTLNTLAGKKPCKTFNGREVRPGDLSVVFMEGHGACIKQTIDDIYRIEDLTVNYEEDRVDFSEEWTIPKFQQLKVKDRVTGRLLSTEESVDLGLIRDEQHLCIKKYTTTLTGSEYEQFKDIERNVWKAIQITWFKGERKFSKYVSYKEGKIKGTIFKIIKFNEEPLISEGEDEKRIELEFYAIESGVSYIPCKGVIDVSGVKCRDGEYFTSLDLASILHNSKTKMLIFIESCHSGRFGTMCSKLGNSYLVFTSCAKDQVSWFFLNGSSFLWGLRYALAFSRQEIGYERLLNLVRKYVYTTNFPLSLVVKEEAQMNGYGARNDIYFTRRQVPYHGDDKVLL